MYVLFLSICSSTFLFKNVGTSGGTKRRAGNMASMSGADDNLYTEFKKYIETSIVQKIRTDKEINVYVLFLSICSITISFLTCYELLFQKFWSKWWYQKACWKYGLYVGVNDNFYTKFQFWILRDIQQIQAVK